MPVIKENGLASYKRHCSLVFSISPSSALVAFSTVTSPSHTLAASVRGRCTSSTSRPSSELQPEYIAISAAAPFTLCFQVGIAKQESNHRLNTSSRLMIMMHYLTSMACTWCFRLYPLKLSAQAPFCKTWRSPRSRSDLQKDNLRGNMQRTTATAVEPRNFATNLI